MVEDSGLYEVRWTPDFAADMLAAVTYVTEELNSPLAARSLFEGVCGKLESQRAMPTSAVTKVGKNGMIRYIVSYKNWDVYYVIEDKSIVAIGLKHHLQAGSRGVLPREAK